MSDCSMLFDRSAVTEYVSATSTLGVAAGQWWPERNQFSDGSWAIPDRDRKRSPDRPSGFSEEK
jgi:hypothetical protein